jgi:hypothetical protein
VEFTGPAGVPELLIITFCVVVVLIPAFRIARKLGYPSLLAVLVFLPFANVLLLWLLAFIEWPIEREFRKLKEQNTAETVQGEP